MNKIGLRGLSKSGVCKFFVCGITRNPCTYNQALKEPAAAIVSQMAAVEAITT